MKSLTVDRLKQVMSYDPRTGKFVRLLALSNFVKRRKKVGYHNDQGYLLTSIDGEKYRLHHLAWLHEYGYLPSELDHINGRRDDNRIANLREVSRLENLKNIKRPVTNTSGHMGVHWHKALEKWRVRFRSGGKYIHGGVFEKIDDAVARRDELYRQHGFHPNHGRAA